MHYTNAINKLNELKNLSFCGFAFPDDGSEFAQFGKIIFYLVTERSHAWAPVDCTILRQWLANTPARWVAYDSVSF